MCLGKVLVPAAYAPAPRCSMCSTTTYPPVIDTYACTLGCATAATTRQDPVHVETYVSIISAIHTQHSILFMGPLAGWASVGMYHLTFSYSRSVRVLSGRGHILVVIHAPNWQP